MKNPLLEKEVWDWQDAAVAADWAMERGVFGADLWRCFPPDFVRCLAECPELLAYQEQPASMHGAEMSGWTHAWAWVTNDVLSLWAPIHAGIYAALRSTIGIGNYKVTGSFINRTPSTRTTLPW